MGADRIRPAMGRRARLAAEAAVTPGGVFEIVAITAGEGNGWRFGPEALRESLALWDGVHCFVDHAPAGRAGPRSVRDLAGVLTGPTWDEARAGVRCRLRPIGPAGPLIEALGQELVAQREHGDTPSTGGHAGGRVGFSADVLFAASGKEVTRILKVLSVDVVINPARGGQFLAWSEAPAAEVQGTPGSGKTGGKTMAEEQSRLQGESGGAGVVEQLRAQMLRAQLVEETEAARAVLQAQAEADEARKARVQMCGYLLESALGAARLPAPAAERVRKQFAGRAFDAAELDAQIEDARKLVSELTGALVVQGPGRLGGMIAAEERLQAAVDDLLGAPRAAALQGQKIERLSGIRELYLMLTGDVDLHGGYDPARVQFASLDFSGLVKNAMNKVVVDKWDELGRAGYDWWRKIVTVEHATTLNDLTGILVGTVGDLPAVAEGAEYTELPVGDSAETAAFTKYGGYIPLTLELIDRDETRKLREYPRALAAAGIRKISSLVAAIFTANSGAGPTMADGGALFNNTAVTTAGGHANLRAGALSAAEWDAAQAAVYNQPMLTRAAAPHVGVGPKMGVNPRFLLVPRALQLAASKILYPTLENAANITSENQQRGQPGDVITVPEWTDPTDWAAACDPRVAPGIYIGERFGLMPEIYIAGREQSPAVFMNDEHRLKVRHFLAVMVADYRPLHKSNVAG